MSINVWISSVCIDDKCINYLMNAIASTLVFRELDKIVISIYTVHDLTPVLNVLKDVKDTEGINYQVIIRDTMIPQFEHIKLLTYEQSLNDDDWVIFLDDDDMYIIDPSEYLRDDVSGFVGYQLIPENNEGILTESYDLNIFNLHEFVRLNYRNMLWVDDFSGTSIRYKYLKLYFGDNYKPFFPRSLEDTNFMNFVEKKTDNPLIIKNIPRSMPFIFHRIKENPSLWKSNLVKDVSIRLKKM